MVETICPVLVVEDDADTAEMLKRHLCRAGVECATASTAEEARGAMKRARPACVILDQMMPDGTGLDLYREMRADRALRDIPVYFYSAGYDWRVQQEAEQLGARGWYVKGVARLPELIERVLNHCRPDAEG